MTTFRPRFQLLRELIPENDQKRDRASFLLEVNLGKGEEEASNDHDLLSCVKLIMEAQHKPQNWMVEPPTDRPVRAYVDGIYDLFHFGHAHSLEQAKKS